MKNNIFALSMLLCLCFFTACSNSGTSASEGTSSSSAAANKPADGYLIEGITQNFPIGSKVLLEQVRGRSAKAIDTTSIKSDGTFTLSGKVPEKDIYRLRIGNVPAQLIVGEQYSKVEVDFQDPRNIKISGNPEAEAIAELTQKVTTAPPDANYISNFIDSAPSPYVAYNAMLFIPFQKAPEIYKKGLARMKKEIPNAYLTTNLERYIAQENSKAQAEKLAGVGAVAQDISLPNPDGKTVKLSDLKGKVVLIDFWASWCRPCRKENPHVVEAYKKYKSKGFEVFSVSLDKDKARWIKAIEQDGLIWDSHVSDLKYWSSAPAQAYGVKSIPATFLIGKDGKIIAKNLRGASLEAKIKEVLG